MCKNSLRNDVIYYIMDNYGHAPEYLWTKFPSYCIFRCPANKKWYAVIMKVSKKQLLLKEDEQIDILVVKANSNEINNLLTKQGFLPAYHMNKKSWITILLDSSVAKEELYKHIDESYKIVVKM